MKQQDLSIPTAQQARAVQKSIGTQNAARYLNKRGVCLSLALHALVYSRAARQARITTK